MEIENIGQNKPMDLKKEMDLKVIALMVTPKELIESMNGKVILSLVATYTQAEAILATQEALRKDGKDIENLVIPHLMVEKKLGDLVELKEKVDIKLIEKKPVETKEETEKKSKKQIISYIRYVSDLVGTGAEKKMSENLIKKFEAKK